MEPQGNAVLWRPVHKDPQVEVGYGAGVQHSPQVSFAGFFLSSFEKMARLEGLEPPTLCFEGRCSIQLSYGRVASHHPTTESGGTNEARWNQANRA